MTDVLLMNAAHYSIAGWPLNEKAADSPGCVSFVITKVAPEWTGALKRELNSMHLI
jgi:hypothetical protein